MQIIGLGLVFCALALELIISSREKAAGKGDKEIS